MNKPVKRSISICLLIVIYLAAGCAVYNSYPLAARPGDTITLALGSADGITPANTTVSYTPDGMAPIPLTIKSIFKLYPDKTSATVANYSNAYYQITETSGHEGWLSVMAIDLPSTGIPAPSSGIIHVNTTAAYPTGASHINDVPISLQVLGGSGLAHPLEYLIGFGSRLKGNLSGLEPSHQVMVTPPFDESAVWPTYGAIELTLKFVADGAPPSEFQLVSDDVSLYTGSERNILKKVTGDELTVSYISPRGLLTYYEPRFSVVPLPAKAISSPPPGTMPSSPPILSSVRYYDVDGNEVSGPVETLYTVSMD
jgi:hypothetical protein